MGFTRRDFLTRVGQAGGYSAAFLTMQGMGLMAGREARAETIDAAPGSGKGVKVAILGGGIAGLVAAYEMRALGYECTVLEARARPGGRNWTVRTGDEIVFSDGMKQTCAWDPGHYQNFGPARLPSIHPTILGYCRKLGVELQVEVNMSNSAFLQNDKAHGGKPVVMRQASNDTRGHVSELLMKCVNQGALDAEMSKEDRDRTLAFLRTYGSLDKAGKYNGSDRAGYKETAGAGDDAGVLSDPLDMHTLLDENFWSGIMFAEAFDMQATMFQPVGGMDRIPYAFAKSLGPIVQYESPVTEIRKTAKGVRIGYKQKGAAKVLEADYCICALPLMILKKTPNDFDEPHKRVVEQCTYVNAYKVAWESRRFWEQDYNVYGGLEFVNVGCSPVWLPSWGMFSDRGILVSGYTDESNSSFGRLTVPEKFEESRKTIERLHPGHGKELEKPLYVGWSRIPWNDGSWIRSYGPVPAGTQLTGEAAMGQQLYGEHGTPTAKKGQQAPGVVLNKQTGAGVNPTAARTGSNPGYEALIQADGPIYFCGDHASHIVGWQEGAALSSLRAVKMIGDKVKAARLAGGPSSVLSV